MKLHIWSKGFNVVNSGIRVLKALEECQRVFRVLFNHSGQFVCKLESLDLLIIGCIRDLFAGCDIDVPIVGIGKFEQIRARCAEVLNCSFPWAIIEPV